MGVRIEGSEDLARDLMALARRSPEAAERAVHKAGRQIVEKAKSYTPNRTGRAARSIHVGGHPELSGDFDPGRDRGWYGDMGEYRPTSAGGAGIQLGSDLFYFRWIENGGPKNAAVRPLGRAVDEGEAILGKALAEEMNALAEDLNL